MKSIKINPIVIILINVIAPTMYIFMSGKYLQIYLFTFAAALFVLMGRFKRLAGYLIVYGVMMGIYYITLNIKGIQFIGLFIIVIIQSVPCIALASILISKYNSAQLLSALETMRVPRVLVVAVTITLKYIPTFRREFSYITESMRLRGIGFTWKKPIKSFQYFIIPQLFRCAALAEEVTAAGLVKGIDAPMRRTSYYEEKATFADVAVFALFLTGLAGGFVWKLM
ncbi:energy-coupling factor transporter transmembrane component T [Pseudobutyrivibrio sp.]|uniref:energy-coupling factor transporter transmembrane component T n=1 Tax=Pseudobutyrivibrio sp. TaxID=2014367 RepID=UPI001B4093FA|nr:energy-coupling factor transporter transmembrane component T [Pseudobutyrivibrio sp.]MBP3262658.1 energy-coupling factor transporter transmembrane protein EcfT [Pseudobutyrivibrio sp.]